MVRGISRHLIGEYSVEIRRQLRENAFVGGKNIKVAEITNVSEFSDPVDRKLLLD
jgi:hypothetical protein